ncbi:MAG: hypothetical protein ACRDBT_06390 [Aeromonas sp.]
MKKTLLVALVTLPLVAHAGLMDALTDSVSSNFKDVANTALSGAMNTATTAAMKKVLGVKEGAANKQLVKEKLGEPASTTTDGGLEVWTYDMGALSKTYPLLTEVGKSLLKDTDPAQKNLVITFDGEEVTQVTLADKQTVPADKAVTSAEKTQASESDTDADDQDADADTQD